MNNAELRKLKSLYLSYEEMIKTDGFYQFYLGNSKIAQDYHIAVFTKNGVRYNLYIDRSWAILNYDFSSSKNTYLFKPSTRIQFSSLSRYHNNSDEEMQIIQEYIQNHPELIQKF